MTEQKDEIALQVLSPTSASPVTTSTSPEAQHSPHLCPAHLVLDIRRDPASPVREPSRYPPMPSTPEADADAVRGWVQLTRKSRRRRVVPAPSPVSLLGSQGSGLAPSPADATPLPASPPPLEPSTDDAPRPPPIPLVLLWDRERLSYVADDRAVAGWWASARSCRPCGCRRCRLDREKAQRRRRIGYVVGAISMVAVVTTAACKIYQVYEMVQSNKGAREDAPGLV